jgi:hypothetical protein
MTRLGKKLLILPALAALCVAADQRRDAVSPQARRRVSEQHATGGLRVAADPYTTVEQTKPAFGKLNPIVHGVVPILLVMQNEGKNVHQARYIEGRVCGLA